MGLFSKWFGKKAGQKQSQGSNTSSNAEPKPNATKRDYEKPERTFLYTPDEVDFSDFTLAGVARIDIILAMARMTGDNNPYDEHGILYEALSDEGVITIPLVMKKGEDLFALFAFYSEAEAANYKKFKQVLVEKCAFKDCYYLSAYDPEKYRVEDGQIEKGTSFHAIFKLEENAQKEDFEGRYSMWWSTPDDPLFLDSPTAEYYQTIYNSLNGYASYLCGMLICGLRRQEFGRINLPEEESLIYVTGPNMVKCILALGQEKGIRFLLPRDKVDADYRNNLLKLVSRSMDFLQKGLEERKVPVDPSIEPNPLDWYTFLIEQMRTHGSTSESIGNITIGDPVIPKEERKIVPEKLVVRMKVGNQPLNLHSNKRQESLDLPPGQEPVFMDFQEDFIMGLAMDTGYSYEFVNQDMLKKHGGQVETLMQQGMDNILNEIKENIQVHGDIQTGACMITCGGNHEASLILFDGFWNQVAEMAQTDICMALPVRDILLVCNFYNTTAMDQMRQKIQQFYYDKDQPHPMSPRIYLRKENQWKKVEEVEAH